MNGDVFTRGPSETVMALPESAATPVNGCHSFELNRTPGFLKGRRDAGMRARSSYTKQAPYPMITM